MYSCYLFVGSCSGEMSCRWMYHQPPIEAYWEVIRFAVMMVLVMVS